MNSLHRPYGAKRYSGATLLGNLGFTGQRKDQTSDLTYFNARYYDQDTGVFLSADTPVATPAGEQPIGSLQVGDMVEAYNPATGKTEAELVQHVWLNHDADLLDVRVKTTTTTAITSASGTAHVQASGHGWLVGDVTDPAVHLSMQQTTASAMGETIHTTANHPWLTTDRGWVAADELRPGERVLTLNGGATGIVVWVHVVPGQADRYNLTVAQDHTYAVGVGQWIVHNIGCLPTLTEAQKWQGINQAKNYAQTNKAKAGAVTKISGHDEVLAKGYSGEIQPTDANGVPGRFAPDAKLTVWQDAGRGNCAEFYCLSLRHRPDAPIDIFIYHERGIGPCSACIETFGKFIDNNNGWPIRAFWLDKSGIIQSQEFP